MDRMLSTLLNQCCTISLWACVLHATQGNLQASARLMQSSLHMRYICVCSLTFCLGYASLTRRYSFRAAALRLLAACVLWRVTRPLLGAAARGSGRAVCCSSALKTPLQHGTRDTDTTGKPDMRHCHPTLIALSMHTMLTQFASSEVQTCFCDSPGHAL